MTTTGASARLEPSDIVAPCGDADELRDRRIRRLRDMGFARPDIEAIMSEFEGVATEGAGAKARDAYARRLVEARDERHEIEELERNLEEAVRALTTESSS